MIFPIDAEIFDKVQHPFTIKICQKFIASFITIIKWKESKCPSIDE